MAGFCGLDSVSTEGQRGFTGTSDEFRYNNSESQTHPNSNNIQFGDSFSTGGFDDSEHQFTRGDDQLGSSAEFNTGLSNTATIGYTVDRNGLEATVGYEGFCGVQAEAEVHGEYCIVGGKISTEAQAGLLGSAALGLTIDSRNGVAGQSGVEYFAGAQINVDVETELGNSVDQAAGLDLKARVGFEASADIEFVLIDRPHDSLWQRKYYRRGCFWFCKRWFAVNTCFRIHGFEHK